MISPSKLLLSVLLALASAFPLGAKVISLSLEELISRSELIVVAKVEKVSNPIIGKRYAKAKVREVWKGAQTETIEFLASPAWTCDISNAEKAETVVLFLIKSEKSRSYQIAHSGRGRMPQRAVSGKAYVDFWEDVRLPTVSPTIDGPKKDHEWIRSIEVSALKDLVKNLTVKKE